MTERPDRSCPLVEALREIVGPEHVLTDPSTTAGYTTDWTGRFGGEARAVVRPKTTTEVAAVLRLCRSAAVGVVPQGGNTGLVGGSTPRAGEVVLSTTRFGAMAPVDATSGTLVADAAATLAQVQAPAKPHGLMLGVDLAARDSATVGGMVATNAGGMHAVRRGAMRAHVLGLEAVLADGTTISRLKALPKDNTGYDLAGLLAGSEGTLAVITRVAMRLSPVAKYRVTALLGVDELASIPNLLVRLRSQLADLEAIELMLPDGMAMVRKHARLRAPFPTCSAATLTVECAADDDPMERLAEAAGACPEICDVAVANDRPGRAALWAYRDRLPEAIAADGPPVKLDVALPARRLVPFLETVPARVTDVCPDARTVIFGHLGDGNLHVNLLRALPCAEAVEDAVLGVVLDLGGSVSSEHGIGTAKIAWLERDRGAGDIAAMSALKAALDPTGLLNPGVLFPLPDANPAPAMSGPAI